VGTDEMHASRGRVEMPGSNNRPRLLEREVSILDFVDEISEGFAGSYRLLCALRPQLLARDGPLARFASDEVRCVLRATRHYGLLLREFDHPDFQRDALELERFVDRLWVGVDESPSLERVIAAERADLLEGDIPLFTTRVGSRDLQTSRGARLPDYWENSGLDLVRRRIELLGEADLERQLWFVRASLATLTLSQDKLQWPSYRPVVPAAQPGSAELAAALTAQAMAIGDRLAALALRDSEDLTWIGLAFHQRQWGLVPLMEDLYAGSSGVIHFLAYLGEISGEERYTRLARAALATLRRRLQQTRPHLTSIGLFNGLGGLIYGFAHWSALWREPALLEEAHALVDRLPELIEADTSLDVVGGSAGCVAALLTLERVAHAPRHLELATACGDRIVAGARRMEVGVGWYTQIETHKPITGFSHGGSGMAHALLQLAETTGHDRFRRTALEALRYEHTQFLPGQGNWMETGAAADESRPDESQAADGQQALSLAWCYGAPGIALARLAALSATPALDAPFLAEEAAAAVRSTRERGFGRNHSLCHGDLGNLDVLLHAASALQNESLATEIPRRAAAVLASMQRDGWICGVPLGVESPALMNGLAGIGYGLLRIAHPERVPSVLAMEPPRL
jgi:type 2 lantibiotic biosynthesis protein LanM